MYVVVRGMAVVGYLEGRFDESYDLEWASMADCDHGAWIFELMVHPEYRRCGLGRRLVRAFLVDARTNGASFVALAVDSRGDQVGRGAFFRSLAFRPLREDGVSMDVMGTAVDVSLAACPASR
jgi:ribosomal protein S18 acetylase RimI-like enzyme